MSQPKVDFLALARAKAAALKAEKLAKEAQQAQAQAQARIAQPASFQNPPITSASLPTPSGITESHIGKEVSVSLPNATASKHSHASVEFTEEQQEAIKLALQGKSFCLIGAAGTGKTTTVRAIIAALLKSNRVGFMKDGTKHYHSGSPAIACVSYTNRAVQNVKKQMPKELHGNCHTIHKTLEYSPVLYERFDENGNPKKVRIFEPKRTSEYPINDLEIIIHDESSMIGLTLHSQLVKATPNAIRIYLGDLNQLPPIYDSAILGFKLNTLPVVELTKIWRQGRDSAIITLAHEIKNGKPMPQWRLEEIAAMTDEIELRPYQKRRTKDDAMLVMSRHIDRVLAEEYNMFEDVILCPQNKGFGCIEMNNCFAQYYSEKAKQPVFQVISGKFKKYFAVGDKVMLDKVDYIIESIEWNQKYLGKTPHPPSLDMNRYGQQLGKFDDSALMDSMDDQNDVDLWSQMGEIHLDEDVADRVNQASHVIKLRRLDDIGKMPSECTFEECSTAGDIGGLDFSYCISVHKSQGSEWNKVFVILHHSHGKMLSRELVYTAVTRARRKLVLYYDPGSNSKLERADDLCNFSKAIKTVEVPGNTWQAKAERFKGKVDKIPSDVDLG